VNILFIALAGLVFLLLLAIALLILIPAMVSGEKRRRLAQVRQYRLPDAEEPTADGVLNSPVARTALAVAEQVVRSGGWESRFSVQLEKAGLKLRPHEWVLIRAIVAVAVTVLLTLAFGWLGLPFGLLFGWLLTAAYHRSRARRRAEKFAAALPPALQLVIGSLRSGFSLVQAIEAMVREVGDPVAGEFSRMLAETRLGMELELALDRLAQRTHNRDLAWTVMAIRVQREVGGNLAEVLETTVTTIRERELLRGHVRSLSAEGRISAWVLIALPVLAALLMFATRRDYLSPLVTDTRGILMLLVGTGLMCAGGIWIARVVRVEV
jgi:tight adherence protein B